MSMKNSLPVNQRKTGRFSLSDCGGPVDNDSASCFCVRRYVPSVHWCCESFLKEHHFVVKKNDKDSATDKPHRCNCDQRWHKSSVTTVGGKNEVKHNNTHTHKKSNGTLLIQLQHSPYSFFLNPLLSGCKLFGIFFPSFLKLKLTQKAFFCI